MTTAWLHIWRQTTHYLFVFLIERAQHVMLFLWIGSQITGYFSLEVAIGLLAVTWVEQNAEFATLAALSWYSCRRVLLCKWFSH